jgi:hypothetical protein
MSDWFAGIDTASIAAVFSAIATALAAYATWQGPRSAAGLAEEMRRKAEQDSEKKRIKVNVFSTLMTERAVVYSAEAVRAFNLIDFVFNESRPVRDAWSDYFSSLDEKNGVPSHAKEEKFRRLLSVMASDIGLADELRMDDLSRVYYPTALAQEEHIRSLQRQQNLRDLQGKTSPAANTVMQNHTLTNIFPPTPTGEMGTVSRVTL